MVPAVKIFGTIIFDYRFLNIFEYKNAKYIGAVK